MMLGECIKEKLNGLSAEADELEKRMKYLTVREALEEISKGADSDFVCPYQQLSQGSSQHACSSEILKYQQNGDACPFFKPMKFCNYTPER